MENKSPEELNTGLPPYSVFPRWAEPMKRCIVGVSVAIILALIIVAGTLIGVYMTQKHTEQMVTVAITNAEGQQVVQTIAVNEREDVAAIYVRSDTYPGTFLFDYKKKLIGFRQPNTTKCFILRMDETKTPTLNALLKGVEYFRTHDATSRDNVIYNFEEVEEANPADVGLRIFLMCSDANIYWARNVNAGQRRFGISFSAGIKIGRFEIGGGIGISFG